jgi:hypothetical protein
MEVTRMQRSIVVPFDGSAEARAALRRAVSAAAQAGGLYGAVLIGTVGLEPADLEDPLEDARRVAGPDLKVEVRWLNPADPGGSLRLLLQRAPNATLAAPVGARGRAPWYAQACRASDAAPRTMLFFLTPRELKTRVRVAPRGRRLGGLLATVRRLLAPLVGAGQSGTAVAASESEPWDRGPVTARHRGPDPHARRPGGRVPGR